MIDELLPRQLTACGSLHDCANKKEYAVHRADHIVAISNTTKSDLIRLYGISSNKISVIYHGVEDIFLSNDVTTSYRKEFPLDKPYILHVGGREGYKNFAFLLKAYAQSKVNKKASLLVVGSQEDLLPEEQTIIREYGLKDKVVLTGYVSDRLLKMGLRF